MQFITVQGDLNLENAQGRLIGRILASVARSEVEVKGERHRLANRQRASQGMPHGSRRPYGYEADLVTVRDTEADILREMARRVVGGQGFRHVAYWLNEQGHTTSLGGAWYPITVRNMLIKPRYGGFREYKGELFPAQWPAIFEPALYERLQLVLKAKHNRNVPKARKFLLTGLAYCGNCGLGLTGATVQDRPNVPKRRIYMCRGNRETGLVRGCGGVRRNADALDWFIREAIFYRLDSDDFREMLRPSDDDLLDEMLVRRSLQQQRLDALIDDYATGVLDKDAFLRAKRTADTSLREIAREIDSRLASSVSSSLPDAESLRVAWERMDTDSRRSIASSLIRKVVVNRGTTKPLVNIEGKTMRFDSRLIEIEWRV